MSPPTSPEAPQHAHWFVTDLGDGMLASEPLQALQDAFSLARKQAENPSAMAAFFRHESDGSLHCRVRVYFSPGAAEFARSVQASACRPPSPEGLSPFDNGDDGCERGL